MTGAYQHRRSGHRYSNDEYLTYERDSGLKHEYDDGAIFGMAGGSRRHSALASRISAALEQGRKPGCVESYRRLGSGAWEYRDTTTGTVKLLSGATIDLNDLYSSLPD